MSQGGSIKERLKKAEDKLDAHGLKWNEAGLPGPKPMYRMADDEFMHHVHVLAVTKMIQDKLGLSDEEVRLYLVEMFVVEAEKLLPRAKEWKKQMVAQQLTQGIVPSPDDNGTGPQIIIP